MKRNFPKENVLTYNKDSARQGAKGRSNEDRAQKIYCDMSRICEIEDAVVEWYDYKYFQRQNEMLNFDYLKELFTIQKFEFCFYLVPGSCYLVLPF